MSNSSWRQIASVAKVSGTALTASTTATSILPAAMRCTFQPTQVQLGTLIAIELRGQASTVVTTPGTLTIDVRFGSTTVLCTTGAMGLITTAQTNANWSYKAFLTCRSEGNSTNSTIIGMGEFGSRILLGSSAVGTSQGTSAYQWPDTAPAVGTGFDDTVANTIDVFATWSLSNANSIQVLGGFIDLCN